MIKKKYFVTIFVFLIFIYLFFNIFNVTYSYTNEDDLLEVINLNEYVKANDNIKLYINNNGNYEEIGTIGKDTIIHLGSNTDKYYSVLDLDKEYFIKDNGKVSNSKEVEYDNRYKNYIVFNKNVSTEITNLYDEDDNLVYSINREMSFPIIIMDSDRYGIEYNNRLLYIKKEDSTITNNHNTDLHNSSGVGVLNYHAFYHKDNEEEASNCTTSICASDEQFRSHLDYFKNNNIFVLKMKELEMYVDGKVQLPKSVLITIDDGGREEAGIELLTKYKMYGTIFLITGWYDASTYPKTEYIELHSHGDLLHDVGKCPGGQGGAIKCLDKESLQKDLKKSREDLNGTTYFAYPFYEYNDYAIQNLKEAGFTMAFIGESSRGDNLVHVGDNKFLLHRFVIVTYTTINDLNKYFGAIK